jgi:hypothetical protein
MAYGVTAGAGWCHSVLVLVLEDAEQRGWSVVQRGGFIFPWESVFQLPEHKRGFTAAAFAPLLIAYSLSLLRSPFSKFENTASVLQLQ